MRNEAAEHREETEGHVSPRSQIPSRGQNMLCLGVLEKGTQEVPSDNCRQAGLLVPHASFPSFCLFKARSQDQIPDRLHAEHGTEEEAAGGVPGLAQ